VEPLDRLLALTFRFSQLATVSTGWLSAAARLTDIGIRAGPLRIERNVCITQGQAATPITSAGGYLRQIKVRVVDREIGYRHFSINFASPNAPPPYGGGVFRVDCPLPSPKA
jgi:hypothetical protein